MSQKAFYTLLRIYECDLTEGYFQLNSTLAIRVFLNIKA